MAGLILSTVKNFNYFADVYLYELVLVYLGFVVLSVLLMVYFVFKNSWFFSGGKMMTFEEYLWTVVPLVILLGISVPSFSHLYFVEVGPSSSLTIKVVGQQWFWSYFYSDFNIQVDSYLLPNEDLGLGEFKLLKGTYPCVVPFGVGVQFIFTSSDVVHSWAVPSLLLKVDCIPGMSSSVNTWVSFPGLYFGMCSELCGAYHSFMPINLEATSVSLFKAWILAQ